MGTRNRIQRVTGIHTRIKATCDIVRYRRLWYLAIAGFFIGDSITTVAGLQSPHFQESNKAVLFMIENYGIALWLFVKVVFMLGFYTVQKTLPIPIDLSPVCALIFTGWFATLWNAQILLVVF